VVIHRVEAPLDAPWRAEAAERRDLAVGQAMVVAARARTGQSGPIMRALVAAALALTAVALAAAAPAVAAAPVVAQSPAPLRPARTEMRVYDLGAHRPGRGGRRRQGAAL